MDVKVPAAGLKTGVAAVPSARTANVPGWNWKL
jgi:hypothetical protein